MRRLSKTIAGLMCAGFLASCQSSGPSGPQVAIAPQATPQAVPTAPTLGSTKPSGINGKWVPTDAAAKGVYVAEFRNGVFVSRSPSNGTALARGSYKVTSATNVELDFVGAATKTAVKAKCERQSPSTMYCVPSIGAPFNLRRA